MKTRTFELIWMTAVVILMLGGLITHNSILSQAGFGGLSLRYAGFYWKRQSRVLAALMMAVGLAAFGFVLYHTLSLLSSSL